MEYHIDIFKGEKYLTGFCKEVPGAMTQGETVEEVKENMKDAILLLQKPVRLPEFSGQTPIQEIIAI